MNDLMEALFLQELMDEEPTKTIEVRFLASMGTALECTQKLNVPLSASEDEIQEALYEYQRDLDGGAYSEVEGFNGDWNNEGFTIK